MMSDMAFVAGPVTQTPTLAAHGWYSQGVGDRVSTKSSSSSATATALLAASAAAAVAAGKSRRGRR
eukprot:CAMPEP_0197620542 /NCGR_PEP_ID=MMETSP1338-20131121/1355_1 /TAXON_ID=43686 ORGANISM="Pelagodinium beii, Strain RCC1491" /NCGR_SAMPLE_ID=MMETSP1338 /ASSEMBLY_ACC=CAM_ASM_000754 /LENGTH=65 /DNA_ID=CAMNT_0043189759 /DNA_START=60 /DNA_END=253 /DNA_ORIENTATION=+